MSDVELLFKRENSEYHTKGEETLVSCIPLRDGFLNRVTFGTRNIYKELTGCRWNGQ